MSVCRIEWITIPAPDLDAAAQFYKHVFGFEIRVFSDGFRVFTAGNIQGGLDRDLRVQPPGIGFSITVESIHTALDRLEKYGGRIITPPYSLGRGAGLCARFADPNGNELELYSAETLIAENVSEPGQIG